MRQKNENKIILKQWIRVFLLIIVIAVIVVSIVSIVKALNPSRLEEKNYILITILQI